MEISARSYQPGGKVLRSPPQDLDEGVVTTGEYSSIRNHGEEPVEHAVDKTVSLEQSQTSELSAGITLDLTSKESASYGGVSADLEQHLGITVNKSESQTSSKTVTTTFSDKVTIDPGRRGGDRLQEDGQALFAGLQHRRAHRCGDFCLWLGHDRTMGRSRIISSASRIMTCGRSITRRCASSRSMTSSASCWATMCGRLGWPDTRAT